MNEKKTLKEVKETAEINFKAKKEIERLPLDKDRKEFLKKYFVNLVNDEYILYQSKLYLAGPGSIINLIVDDMEYVLESPFEVPLFTFFTLVSSYLSKKDFKIKWQNKVITPEIWTIILADSGLGKSTNHNELSKIMDIEPDIYGIDTRAGFFEELKNIPSPYIYFDEIFNFLERMNDKKGDTKQIEADLLSLYNGQTIKKATKSDPEKIINKRVSFLGYGVSSRVISLFKKEDFVSGFLARFFVIFADNDKNRPKWAPMRSFKNTNKIKQQWEEIAKQIDVNVLAGKTEYTVIDDAKFWFDYTWSKIEGFEDLDLGIRKRLFDTMLKWALIHAVVNHPETNIIDSRDVVYASYLLIYLLRNYLKLIDKYLFLPYQRKQEKVLRIVKRLKAQGLKIKARTIFMREPRFFSGVDEIRYCLEHLGIKED